MKNPVRLAMSTVAVALFAVSAFSQDARVAAAAGDFVISASAGGISAYEGAVSVARKDGSSGSPSKSDSLKVGDVASTGADGKLELMLNPGSFVRLGPDSRFSFVTTDLDDLIVNLESGSAVFEVYAGDDFTVKVKTPGAVIPINRSGVFRVDVLADGSSRVSVWKGRLVVGKQKVTLKSGRAMVAKGSTGGILKFDTDDKDALDLWSQMRGREAARANAKLQRKALTGALVSSYQTGAWDMYRSFGVWVYDRTTMRWFFLPFGSGWRSPYGHDFGNDIWRFRLPYWVYYPNVTVTNGNPGGGSGTGSTSGGSGSGTGTVATVPPGRGGWRTENKDGGGATREQLPVFRQFENTQRTYGGSPVVGFPDNGFRGGSSSVWSGGGSSGGMGGGAIDSRPSSGGSMQTSSPVVAAPPGQSRIGSKDDN